MPASSLGGLTIASLQRAATRLRRELLARGARGPATAARAADDAQAQAPVAAGGFAGRAGRRGGAGADGAQRQSRLLLFADPGRGEARRARSPLPPGRPGRGRQREEERPGSALHRHRHPQDAARASIAACCPTCSARARAWSPRARWAPTASSPPREVLAKHDENYMPPEVAKAIKEAGQWRSGNDARHRLRLRTCARLRSRVLALLSAAGTVASLAGAMIPELGHFALILALAVALVQGTLPLVGASRGDARLMALGRTAALTQAFLVILAFGALTQAYVTSDFSVANVVANSHSAKPLIYKISGVWGNHEGSMLLWALILSLFGAAVALFGANLPDTPAQPRARHPGADRRRLPGLPALHLEPLRARLARAARRQRPQPAAAGSRPRLPSAAALSRLCRLLGDLRLRHRRPARGQGRRRLGALGAAVDARRLVLPDPRHRARAAGGPTTSSAGAASGSGIPSRTPR